MKSVSEKRVTDKFVTKKRITCSAWLILTGLALMYAGDPDLLQYVNILQGTNSHFGFSNGNLVPEKFRCYFVLEIDQPFKAYGTGDP